MIALGFADVKEVSFSAAREKICQIIKMAFGKYRFLLDSDFLAEDEKEDVRKLSADPDNGTITLSLKMLSLFLSRYYGKKAIILLDEYDTPMQEAYVNGYWDEMTAFIRSLFNSTFKTNPYLFRAVMTGITRISKESVFSDLNNLTVITTTSDAYGDCFGFTQQEVWNALEEYGLSAQKELVKAWYDGFVFGRDVLFPGADLRESEIYPAGRRGERSHLLPCVCTLQTCGGHGGCEAGGGDRNVPWIWQHVSGDAAVPDSVRPVRGNSGDPQKKEHEG